MKAAYGQAQRQLDFGQLVGPFSILLTVGLSFFKPPSNPLFFPWLACAGAVVCWTSRWRGFAASLALLAGMAADRFMHVPSPPIIWELSLYGALALGFLTTVLCAQDLPALPLPAPIQPLEDPALNTLSAEVGSLKKQLADSQQFCSEKEGLLASQENLLKLARDEIAAGQALMEKMRTELGKQRQRAKADLEKTELELKDARRELSKLSSELAESKRRLQHCAEQIVELQKQRENSPQPPIEGVFATPSIEQVQEKGEIWQQLRRYEGLYHQLRKQFDDKCAALDQCRKDLFHSEEKLEGLLRETREELRMERSAAEKSYEKHILEMESMYAQEILRLTEESLQQESFITELLKKQ